MATTDHLQHQWLLTYFYRGHNTATWSNAVHHPLLHHPLVRWHFAAKPPRLKNHQRQPVEWTDRRTLDGRRVLLRTSVLSFRRCILVVDADDEDSSGSVSQPVTADERLRTDDRGTHQQTPLPDCSDGGDWQSARSMTLTCFVVGRSVFVVRMDLKWFRLSVRFQRMAENGHRRRRRRTMVDVFVFDRPVSANFTCRWLCDGQEEGGRLDGMVDGMGVEVSGGGSFEGNFWVMPTHSTH